MTRDRLRVALVHNRYASGVPSGETAVVEAELRALRRAGVRAEVFGTSSDQLKALPLGRLRSGLAWARASSVAAAQPLAGLDDFAPDIVHVHNTFPGIGQRWTDHVRVPVVHTLHNFRHFCAAATLTRDLQPCRLCVEGSRWNAVRFGCYQGSRIATAPFPFAPGPQRSPLLRNARRVIALNRAMYDELVEAGHGEVAMLEPANFLEDELGVRPAGSPRGEHWLYVGRLDPEKGILQLLRQWPTRQRVRVAGGGSDAEEIARIADVHPDIEYLGLIPRESVHDELRRSRGLLVPSMWAEGMPVVYIEAMATDTPVAATAGSSPGDLVRAQGTGWCFASVSEMAAGLADTVAPETGVCRAAFEAHYTEAAFVERRLGLYQELLDEWHRGVA